MALTVIHVPYLLDSSTEDVIGSTRGFHPLAFRQKSLKPFKLFHLRSEAVSEKHVAKCGFREREREKERERKRERESARARERERIETDRVGARQRKREKGCVREGGMCTSRTRLRR